VVGANKLGRACRIYAPVGSHETLLAYLVRRLLENGANSSFVNRIVDESVSLDELVADPLAEAAALGGIPHSKIVLPTDLYGHERKNSCGLDLSNEQTLAVLQQGLTQSGQHAWKAYPMLGSGDVTVGEAQPVRNPADLHDTVGSVVEASAADVDVALGYAQKVAVQWAETPVDVRADCLERMADLMEEHMSALMGLAVREAGKSLPNAIAEIREAVDFCRYYAAQARTGLNNTEHPALGPVVAISPWNFPLAIFIGEVAAALVAGNPVLAKPAEQTTLIAAEAVRLFHLAGIPREVLQFLPGRGEVVGAALTADPRVQGVIFTGSTEVAQIINRSLAKRGGDSVLVAETGGQNAMIVDSSALPEQVVADVLSSAFDSAGQRCSALRVLYLQQDIADKVVEMIIGAMDELRVGNPAKLETDVGPVIDAEARDNLLKHIDGMKQVAKRWHQTRFTAECENGTFVAPTLFEIDHISRLQREVFGPVLHVIRFEASQLDAVIDEIASSGYGLTQGVHSRIDETIDTIARQAKVGNLYVNRNIVGAVVGVQPFGGEGLSGTGPKAGGPFYLYRLTRAAQWMPSLKTEQNDAALPLLDRLEESLPLLLGTCAGRAGDTVQWARNHSPLRETVLLPGPTGEDNKLRFAPRGTIGCVSTNLETLIGMLTAALATGNRVLVQNGYHNAPQLAQLGKLLDGALEVVADVFEAEVSAVMFAGDGEACDAARRKLAARSGALIPLITAQGDAWNLHRLVVERSVSVNTTAAGGNASLMSLGA
jgi:RHH-type proline utilization regulon transcriptional repressor/proline dehydrogenase/delta 1-pyrroline-5-carboxylate dehydrogenase